MALNLPISSCGQVLGCVDDGSQCLVEDVKVLPEVDKADCHKIYSDLNDDVWIVSDGKWLQVNKDKNSHVKAVIKGNNGISVIASGEDNQTFIIDGSELVKMIEEKTVDIKAEPADILTVTKADGVVTISAEPLKTTLNQITADILGLKAKSHAIAVINGNEYINVTAGGEDNQTFTLNTDKLIELINSKGSSIDIKTLPDNLFKVTKDGDTFTLDIQGVVDLVNGKQDKITNRVQTVSEPYYTNTESTPTHSIFQDLKRGEEATKYSDVLLNETGASHDTRFGNFRTSSQSDANRAFHTIHKINGADVPDDIAYLQAFEDNIHFQMLENTAGGRYNFDIIVGEKPNVYSSANVLQAWRSYLQFQPKGYRQPDTVFGRLAAMNITDTYDYIKINFFGISSGFTIPANTEAKLASFPAGFPTYKILEESRNNNFTLVFTNGKDQIITGAYVRADGIYSESNVANISIPLGYSFINGEGYGYKVLTAPNVVAGASGVSSDESL